VTDDSRKLRMWSLSDCMYDICIFVFDKPLLYVKHSPVVISEKTMALKLTSSNDAII
jgi:hypothetical protein